MIKSVLAFIILVLLALLQITLIDFLPYPPQLVLILSLTLFLAGFKRGALWSAFLGGLLLDLFSLSPLGLTSLLWLLLLSFLTLLKKVYPPSFLGFVVAVFLASLLYRSSAFFFSPIFLLRPVLLGAFFDTLFFILAFPGVKMLSQSLLAETVFQLDFKDRL